MRRSAALWLAAATAADYAASLLLPALLVRTLSPLDFGGYRILWMAAQSSALLLSFNLALNLIYIAPQHPAGQRGALLGNVFAYLLVAALVAASLCDPLLHLLADGVLADTMPRWALPLFVAAWMVSLPFDQLALVTGQPRMQAAAMMAQAVLRIALIGGAAWFARDLAGVAAAMAGLALCRLALALAYARSSGAFTSLRVDLPLAGQQLRHAVGFGLGASLFVLRNQLDAWLAALLFDPVSVAVVSIALTIVPIIGMVRQVLTSATVSDIARLVADGHAGAALALNRRANLATALLVFPLVGAFVAVAPHVIAFVYTPAYVSAAAPARLYAIAYAVCVLEMSTLVQALGDGRFVARSGAVLLAAGTLASIAGAACWGLPGLAIGSLCATWLGSAWNLLHVAARLGQPVAALQPWREMALLAAIAGLSSCAALAASGHLGTGPAWQRALAGCALYTAVYAPLALLVPSTRRLYLGLRHGERRSLPAAASHS